MVDVRLSEQSKDQLIRLKRLTGIKNWNILCRWALCISMAEGDAPSEAYESNESAIEIRWDVFGGEWQSLYYTILAYECNKTDIEVNDRNIGRLARLHIHRGINILINRYKISSLEDLIRLAS